MDQKERAERLESMRKLTDFLEAHPDLPLPSTFVLHYPQWINCPTLKDLQHAIRMFPKTRRSELDGSEFIVQATPPDGWKMNIHLVCPRSLICTRRQVGERIVPASPERVVPKYEWDCPDSVLGLIAGEQT